jgi:ATP-dependent RNA helicase RhlE
MAARQAASAQPDTLEGSVLNDGVTRVVRARGQEPAGSRKERRNKEFIASEQAERDRRAAEKTAKAAEPVKESAPARSEQESAPAKKRRNRKKSSAKAEAPVSELPKPQPPKAEQPKKTVPPAPAEMPSKRSARGVRRGDLSATMPAAPTVPTADFVRPNPLDSDVIMDATARLLAPRKPIYSQPKPESAPKQESTRPPHKENKHTAKPGSKPAAKQTPAPKAEPVREASKTDRPVEKHRHRHDHKARIPARSSPSGNRQKDSTEQRGSMMRP